MTAPVTVRSWVFPVVSLAFLLVLPETRARSGEDTTLHQERSKKATPPKGGKDGGRETPKDKSAGSEKKTAAGRALEGWGTLKDVKGADGFWTLDYTKVEGGKGKKLNAFVKIPADAEVYQDKSLRITDLKEGDAIWLFGRPVERETQTSSGVTGLDRQLQTVMAIAKGEGLRVNLSYRDPKDKKMQWCEATVKKAGPAITVTFEGEAYKVTLGNNNVPIVSREKAEDAKAIKSGILAEVSGDKLDEKPETKNAADAKKDSFAAKKVVVLDRRFATSLYPILLE